MTPIIMDWTMLAIIGIAMLIGFIRGTASTLTSTIVWIVAVLLSILLNDWLSHFITKVSFLAHSAHLIAGISALIVILLIGFGIIKIFDFMQGSGKVNMISRLIGALLGVVKGAFIVLALVFVLNMSTVATQKWWLQSEFVQGVVPWVQFVQQFNHKAAFSPTSAIGNLSRSVAN